MTNGRKGKSSRERIFKKTVNSHLSSLRDYRERKERHLLSPPVEKTEREREREEREREKVSPLNGLIVAEGKKKKIGIKPGSGMFALPAKRRKRKKKERKKEKEKETRVSFLRNS